MALDLTDDTVLIDTDTPPTTPKKAPGRPKGTRKRGDTGQIDPKVQANLHDLVLSGVNILNIFLGDKYRFQRKEIDDIFQPLERIILRHVPMAGVANPDYADAALVLMGIVLYADRIGAFEPKPNRGTKQPELRQPPVVPEAVNGTVHHASSGQQSTGYPTDILSHFDALGASIRGSGT